MLRKRVKDQDKEIRCLKEENEFLEEASAFFAASRRKSLRPVSYTHLDVYKRQYERRQHDMKNKKYSIIYSSLTGNTKVLADACLLYTSRCV